MLPVEQTDACPNPPSDAPTPLSRMRGVSIAVAFRRQTSEEERQFGDAVKLFLSEIVRQHVRQEQK
jgi:hypothetical protein